MKHTKHIRSHIEPPEPSLPDYVKPAEKEFLRFRKVQSDHSECFDPAKLDRLDELWRAYAEALDNVIQKNFSADSLHSFKQAQMQLVRDGFWESAPKVGKSLPKSVENEYDNQRHVVQSALAQVTGSIERMAASFKSGNAR